MPRPRSYVIKNGKTIDGVSYHAKGGYYIIVGGKRQYFGKGDTALREAKASYDRSQGQPEPIPQYLPALSREGAERELQSVESSLGKPLLPPNLSKEQAIEKWRETGTIWERTEILQRLGYEPDTFDPDFLSDFKGGWLKLNPEWTKRYPDQAEEVINEQLGLPSDYGSAERERERKALPPTNPNGVDLTISQIGRIYREWYLSDKGRFDLEALNRQAEIEREKLTATLQELEARQEKPRGATVSKAVKRNGPSRKRGAQIKALQRRLETLSWVDFLPRRFCRGYREHLSLYNEFVDFMTSRHGADIPVAHLTGDDLRTYYLHVRDSANKNKHLENKDKWRNARHQAVTTAFRRAKRIHPDAKYPQGLFGEDGLLSILECRNTTKEAEKTLLTPAEFRALVGVADTQWSAILYLSMNAALENESVSQIPWSAIDWNKKLMVFPRPKTGRPRQTPLAPQTMQALTKWRAESKGEGEGNIFRTPHGGEWLNWTDSLGKHWDLLKKEVKKKTKAEIPATFKSLRKTASTTVMSATDNERAVDMLLGHAPLKSWRHYVGLAPDYLHKAVQAIEKEFFR